jgi:hypothetical protein
MKIFLVVVVFLFSMILLLGSISRTSAPPAEPSDPDEGMAFAAVAVIRQAQRNPERFSLEKILVTERAVCLSYKGENGFGGISWGKTVFDKKTHSGFHDSENGFTRMWNRECANKTGKDFTDVIRGNLKYNSAIFR